MRFFHIPYHRMQHTVTSVVCAPQVLLGYRVERYDPAYTAPLLVAIFASLPGGANLEMLQQRGRGKSSGKRLLEAGTLAANAAAAGAATNSTTGSSSGTSGSTDGTAASGTTSAPTFAAAGGVVSCANARPLTAASLRDYGIPMPYNVFKELLDVEGGQLQPDGSTWEVAVQVRALNWHGLFVLPFICLPSYCEWECDC